MESALHNAFERDRKVWNACARVYEEQIVGGHPDVLAYEGFEEDLLDRLLWNLIRDQDRSVHLLDVGCGSGRLHLRYGLKRLSVRDLPPERADILRAMRAINPEYCHDPILARGLVSVDGLDFSVEMLDLAREKLRQAGLGDLVDGELTFRQGSAFELTPLAPSPLPVAVTVCNSVGVMQGPEGAAALFESLRRAVEPAGGIALISGYCRDAVRTCALGAYESTLDVCGQPRWLAPDTYAGEEYIQRPKAYKRAHDSDPFLAVDVYDRQGALVAADHVLTRIPEEVEQTVATGHIRTHTDYQSHWYSAEQFDQWIGQYWSGLPTWRLAGRRIDALRAEPAQVAILDAGDRLGDLMRRWQGDDA